MALERGFKAQANRIAAEVRTEMDLAPLDPLDPLFLAEHLAIPAWPLSHMAKEIPDVVEHFSSVDSGAFSAVTVFRGTRRQIIYNDSHSRGRQNSDLSHECAHGLLQHAPRPAFDGTGCRDWNGDEEDEANFLGAALLVTEEAALSVVRREMELGQAAQFYGVSRALMRWRINATGAAKRVARSRRARLA